MKIGPGDIPLLYIGRWKRRAALGPWTGQVAGYYPDTIPWMHERMPSFIGHDFNIDWNPRPGWEGMRNPIHVAALNWMGINIIECLDLEEAVEHGAQAEPLRVRDHVRTAAGGRRHRVAGQPACDVLNLRPALDDNVSMAVRCQRCSAEAPSTLEASDRGWQEMTCVASCFDGRATWICADCAYRLRELTFKPRSIHAQTP